MRVATSRAAASRRRSSPRPGARSTSRMTVVFAMLNGELTAMSSYSALASELSCCTKYVNTTSVASINRGSTPAEAGSAARSEKSPERHDAAAADVDRGVQCPAIVLKYTSSRSGSAGSKPAPGDPSL